MPCYSDLLDYQLIETAFRKVQSNKGAAGTDNVTIEAYADNLDLGLHLLLSELAEQQFRSAAFLKVSLKRPDKKNRNLVIPTVRDRIIHTAIMLLLQPIFELEFEKCSYGYRPNRSYKMAVEQVARLRGQGYRWLVDADIKHFFDEIPHTALRKLLKHYQLDDDLINLISECLFSRQSENGILQFGSALGLGIPQGSSLSPMMANLYLDYLDETLLAKNYNIVRYADDFVILTKSKADASLALDTAQHVLTQLNLSLNLEKTTICSFNEGFEFLGHTFIDDFVFDNKSQLPIVANSTEQQDIDTLLEQSEAQIDESNDDEEFREAETESPISRIIFDAEQWELVGKQFAQGTHVQLSPKLKTLYVTTQGAVLSKSGLRIQIKKGVSLLQSVPLGTLDGILLLGRVHLTNDVMSYCLVQSIPIVLANQVGSFKGIIDNYSAYSEKLLRQQVRHTASQPKQIRIAKLMLKAKFNNSVVILKRALRKKNNEANDEQLLAFTDSVKRFLNKLERENSVQSMLGIEGQVAKQYLGIFKSLFSDEWEFTNRNRQPPQDPINVLLSLGYSILFNNIHTLMKLHKINPTLGYLHHGADEQPSLVLDLMEEFRAPIVDATVYKLVNRRSITANDFEQQGDRCVLKKHGFNLFIQAIEDKFNSQLIHPSTQDLTDYRRIIDSQIRLLKQSIEQDSEHYEAFCIR